MKRLLLAAAFLGAAGVSAGAGYLLADGRSNDAASCREVLEAAASFRAEAAATTTTRFAPTGDEIDDLMRRESVKDRNERVADAADRALVRKMATLMTQNPTCFPAKDRAEWVAEASKLDD